MLKMTMGLMESGKSKDLIIKYNFESELGKYPRAYTYNPNGEDIVVTISTRDTRIDSIPAINLHGLTRTTVETLLDGSGECVFIDEIQFAPKSHIDLIIAKGKEKSLFCYGLYLDYLDKDFESTKYLRESASELLGKFYKESFLKASCNVCKGEAKHNIRVNNQEELFVVSKDVYKTVCTKCKKEIEG